MRDESEGASVIDSWVKVPPGTVTALNAEIDRLRAELEAESVSAQNWERHLKAVTKALRSDRDKAEAKLARVRELCVTLNRDYPRNECAHLFLRALDGG